MPEPTITLEILKIIAGSTIGGLIGAISTHLFALRRERIGRMRTLNAFLRLQRHRFEVANLAKMSEDHLVKMHQEICRDLVSKCIEATPDIPERHRSRFESAYTKFHALSVSEIEPRALVGPDDLRPIVFPDFEEGRRTIIRLIDELVRCTE